MVPGLPELPLPGLSITQSSVVGVLTSSERTTVSTQVIVPMPMVSSGTFVVHSGTSWATALTELNAVIAATSATADKTKQCASCATSPIVRPLLPPREGRYLAYLTNLSGGFGVVNSNERYFC